MRRRLRCQENEAQVSLHGVDLKNSSVVSIETDAVHVCFVLKARLLPKHPRLHESPSGEAGSYAPCVGA